MEDLDYSIEDDLSTRDVSAVSAFEALVWDPVALIYAADPAINLLGSGHWIHHRRRSSLQSLRKLETYGLGILLLHHSHNHRLRGLRSKGEASFKLFLNFSVCTVLWALSVHSCTACPGS